MSLKNYAQVVIGLEYTGNNEIFYYVIPEEMTGTISEGMRVLVPFGKGNKLYEGYIVGIKQTIDDISIKQFKRIISVIDSKPILSSKGIKLAKWMARRYLCSLNEAILQMVPSELKVKSERYVKFLSITEQQFNKLNENEKKVVELIRKKINAVSVRNISKQTGLKDLYLILCKLKKQGIIDFDYKIYHKVKSKYEQIVKLAHNTGDYNISARANVQREILNIVKKNKSISKKELSRIIGKNINSSLNSLIKKGLLIIEDKCIERDAFLGNTYKRDKAKIPSFEQKQVIDAIVSNLKKDNSCRYLIHGVTGSGKTEIYMQIIQKVLDQNKQVIVLVPEISLTPQIVAQFKSRFGDIVGVIHSALSDGERYDQWKKIRQGKVSIVIGARSAIFVPFENLGMIIIDEEHESTYKSNVSPRYDTIEVAEKRAEIENAILVLASATPSLESYYKSLTGKYTLLKLNKRINDRPMPELEIIDMRNEIQSGNRSIFSQKLFDAVKQRLDKNEQVILFLNRRGYSTFISCRKCGYVLKCKNCDITMTYHKDSGRVECHYCGYTIDVPYICPKCKSKYIKYFGIGTQKVEELTKKMFKGARVARMDVDTTRNKGSHDKILSKFKNQQIDILIGTQMISKGLDFKNVTLVGVIAADITINLPDFRSAERTFQLITQVAGRAGRGEKKGQVLVQTFQPDHYSLKAAQYHDYQKFYRIEQNYRKTFKYPPFTEIINIIVKGLDERQVINTAQQIYIDFNNYFKKLTNRNDIILLGPSVAPIPKIKGMFRWQIIIKTRDIDYCYPILEKLNYNYHDNYKKKGIFVTIDINPKNIM